MEDVFALLVFVIIAIFSGLAKYRESQKGGEAPPPVPRRPANLPEATRRQFQRREIATARPAKPAEPVEGPQRRVAPQPRPAPRPPRPAARPTPVTQTAEPVASRPTQQPAQALAQMGATAGQKRAGRQAARQALLQAVEQETDTGQAEAAAKRERRTQAVPLLFRNMDGIRAGIIFNEVFNPPLSLR